MAYFFTTLIERIFHETAGESSGEHEDPVRPVRLQGAGSLHDSFRQNGNSVLRTTLREDRIEFGKGGGCSDTAQRRHPGLQVFEFIDVTERPHSAGRTERRLGNGVLFRERSKEGELLFGGKLNGRWQHGRKSIEVTRIEISEKKVESKRFCETLVPKGSK